MKRPAKELVERLAAVLAAVSREDLRWHFAKNACRLPDDGGPGGENPGILEPYGSPPILQTKLRP